MKKIIFVALALSLIPLFGRADNDISGDDHDHAIFQSHLHTGLTVTEKADLVEYLQSL